MRRSYIALGTVVFLGLITFGQHGVVAQLPDDVLAFSGIIKMDQDRGLDFTLITVRTPGQTYDDAVFRLQHDQEHPAAPIRTGSGTLLYARTRLTITFQDGGRYLFRVAGADAPLTSQEVGFPTYEVVGLARFKMGRATHEELVNKLMAPLVGQCTGCQAGGEGSTQCSISCVNDGSCSTSCQWPQYFACCGCRPGAYCTCCRSEGSPLPSPAGCVK